MKDKMDLNDNVSSESALREAAEDQLGESPAASPELKKLTSEKIIHELQVHQIELEMQNDELKRVQLELEASRDEFQDLYDFAPVGYFTLTGKGLITQANLTGADLLGMPRPKIIRRGFGNFVANESLDQWDKHILTVLAHEEKQSCVLALKREGGSSFYARLESISMDAPLEPQGENNGNLIRMAVSDITERKQIEEALRESEAKFGALFDTANDAIFLMDREKFIECNAKTLQMFGCQDKKDIVGHAPFEFSPDKQPDGLDSRENALKKINAASNAGVQTFYWKHCRKDGSPFDAEVSLNAVTLHGKKHVQAIVRDITERKQAEEALRDSRENFLTCFETMDDVIVVAARDGSIMYANQALSLKLGYSTDELTAMHVLDLNPKNRRQEAERIFSDMFKGERESCPLPIEKKDGTLLPVETRVWLGKWSGMDCAFGICKDLSKEQEALQKFNRLFNGNPALMAVSSLPEGRFTEVNDSFVDTMGFSREDVIGKTSEELGLFVEPEKQRAAEELAYNEGFVRNVELKVRKKDGTIAEGLFFVEIIDWQGQKNLLTVVVDITERKQLEKERLEMERRLLHAQKLESLAVMAGGIAHDFNNLLMVVLGNLELALTDRNMGVTARSSIANAIQASESSAELSRQMLIYSGSAFYPPRDLDLNELAQKSEDLFKSVMPKTITFHFLINEGLPFVRGDEDQVQRVMANLVMNASEAISHCTGEVTLRTGLMDCDETCLSHSRLEEKPDPGLFVFLEVTDTGCGMDNQTLHRLFDPFFTTKFWGRGLGMAEVLGIVKGHHGAIMVETEVGKGTTVRVLFPSSEKEQTPFVVAKEKVATRPLVPTSPAGRKTILVVDDEPSVRQLCVEWLDLLGYDTIAAVDGAEAVQIFCERMNEIDMVLLDFVMPRMNGVEAFEELIRVKPDVKVILSSGYTEEEMRQRFSGRQPESILHKPYEMDILKAELEGLLGTEG